MCMCVCLCTYMCMYMCVRVNVYVYIYMYEVGDIEKFSAKSRRECFLFILSYFIFQIFSRGMFKETLKTMSQMCW